jgi:hypothetical protein
MTMEALLVPPVPLQLMLYVVVLSKLVNDPFVPALHQLLVQLVTFVDDHVIAVVLPDGIVEGVAESIMVGVGVVVLPEEVIPEEVLPLLVFVDQEAVVLQEFVLQD